MSKQSLSQEHLEKILGNLKENPKEPDAPASVSAYDFRRPDRIPKDQIRSIYLLYENFCRSLAANLSAYLRALVVVNLASVEQMAFSEFSQSTNSSSCILTLDLRPQDGSAVVELSQTLVFPILEMLLGGGGTGSITIEREITEIEKSILEGVLRIISKDMRTAWLPIATLEFAVNQREPVQKVLHSLAPNEGIVLVNVEMRVGDRGGTMKIGIPSIIIKMLRQKFDSQWTTRRMDVQDADRTRTLNLIQQSSIQADVRLNGIQMKLGDLMKLNLEDVLSFDHPVDRPLDLHLNGKSRFAGQIVTVRNKLAFQVKADYGQ